MCDSVYVLKLNVLKPLDPPVVTVEDTHTLVSSAAKGNQWFYEDGLLIEGATEQKFTPDNDGVYYVAASNGSCYSDPSAFYRIQLTDNIDMNLVLEKGWNWISHNLNENLNISQFDAALRILSQGEETYNDNSYGFVGDLKELRPVEGYKVQMSEDDELKLTGTLYKVNPMYINLSKGWNWIGYVPVSDYSVSEALSNLDPAENDVIKAIDDFAIYSNGKWNGTLTTLEPGHGYMYFSQSKKRFSYPLTCVYAVDNSGKTRMYSKDVSAPWTYDKHQYPDNQTMVAELFADNSKAMEGIYSVGAFVDDECRGIGSYIDGLLYITIHGTIGDRETISFKAFDNVTENELPVMEPIVLDGMQTGTVKRPYSLHISTTTHIDNVSTSLNIYPNPVRDVMYINGDTSRILDLKILSLNGNVVYSTDNYSNEGINVTTLASGVYVIAIHTSNGYQYKKILKVN